MDLLDSILSGMEKPPTVARPAIKDEEKRKKFEKLQKERQEAEKKRKQYIDNFRADVAKRVQDFVNRPVTDETDSYKIIMDPMDKISRSIVHETCEEHEDELVVHSFGTEEVDRHCIIWKRGFEPCEAEIRAMKAGVEYNPKTSDDEQESEEATSSSSQGKTEDGKDKFWQKYEKIIGENASGIESAKIAVPAKQYGFVPVSNKKDLRSIEQITIDMRKNKKQKTSDGAEPSQSEPTDDKKVEEVKEEAKP